MQLQSDTAYRSAVGLALAAAFLIVWFNVAAVLMGIEDDDPANMLYVGVLAIGFIGAIMARFKSQCRLHFHFRAGLAPAFTFDVDSEFGPGEI